MPAATRVLAFLLVFATLLLMALGLTIVSEFYDIRWIELTIRIGEGLGRLTLISVAIAFILVEGAPMLAAWLKREMVKEAKERGRAEAFREWQDWRSRVEDWERRKAEAEREGRAFNEPAPQAPDAEQHTSV